MDAMILHALKKRLHLLCPPGQLQIIVFIVALIVLTSSLGLNLKPGTPPVSSKSESFFTKQDTFAQINARPNQPTLDISKIKRTNVPQNTAQKLKSPFRLENGQHIERIVLQNIIFHGNFHKAFLNLDLPPPSPYSAL